MKYAKNILSWIAILVIIVLICINIYISLFVNGEKHDRTNQRIDNIEKRIEYNSNNIQPYTSKDGYTPVKGIDYFDGANGSNGEKGDKGEKGDTGRQGENGKDGLTPEIRCNIRANAWEVRYSQDEAWKILGDYPTRCTI